MAYILSESANYKKSKIVCFCAILKNPSKTVAMH